MATRYNVICFGDSGARGWGDTLRGGGVPARLEQDFHKQNFDAPQTRYLPSFENCGAYGESAQSLLERFAFERDTRRRDMPILNIVGIGMNDAMTVGRTRRPLVGEETFASLVKDIAREAQIGDDALVYVGMSAFNEATVNPYRRRVYLEPARVRKYESIACELVEKAGGTALALFDASEKAGFAETMLSVDGLHPNTDGYDWVYRQVAPTIHDIWKE